MRKSRGLKAMEKTALQNGVDVAEIRKEIELAIETGMADPDPEVQAFWNSMPKKGEKPTPEEAIVYIADKVKADKKTHNFPF